MHVHGVLKVDLSVVEYCQKDFREVKSQQRLLPTLPRLEEAQTLSDPSIPGHLHTLQLRPELFLTALLDQPEEHTNLEVPFCDKANQRGVWSLTAGVQDHGTNDRAKTDS